MKVLILFQKRFNFFLKALFVLSFIFIVYQLVIFWQLSKSEKTPSSKLFILGTHRLQKNMYKPDDNGMFNCITSQEKIEFKFVNDDYCDCLDGTDEPATNACPNGQFFCHSQAVLAPFKRVLPSSKVNDGICDCCDGSDEWERKILKFSLPREIQKKINRYFSPCPILC